MDKSEELSSLFIAIDTPSFQSALSESFAVLYHLREVAQNIIGSSGEVVRYVLLVHCTSVHHQCPSSCGTTKMLLYPTFFPMAKKQKRSQSVTSFMPGLPTK